LAFECLSTRSRTARYRRLVHRLGRALVDVHEEWAGEVERELGGRPAEGD
jgi:hypothetical protein